MVTVYNVSNNGVLQIHLVMTKKCFTILVPDPRLEPQPAFSFQRKNFVGRVEAERIGQVR